MIGLVVGGITALVILVFFGKDEKAVRQYK
jgi:hypothetical protein